MRLGEIVVERQRPFVALLGLVGLAGVMASQAQVVPGLPVRRDQGRGTLQFFHGLRVFALLDQPFALEQGSRARRRAT